MKELENKNKRKTRREVWDILEEQLFIASSEKIIHDRVDIDSFALSGDSDELEPYRRLMISIIISSGRNRDFKWLETDIFKAYCVSVGLESEKVKRIILLTNDSFKGRRKADFDLEDFEF